MQNESGLEPLGQAVLVQHYEPERKGALIELPDSVEMRSMMIEQRVIVIAVGPAAWKDEKKGWWIFKWPAPRAKVGDRVYVSSMAGFMTKGPKDGKTYRVVNGRDIFLKITSEE